MSFGAFQPLSLRLPNRGPAYPPYGDGISFDAFFLDWWEKHGQGESVPIPVHWTDIYNDYPQQRRELQRWLDQLQPGPWFAVAQHDDAIQETIPAYGGGGLRIRFCAGGNGGGIPIPLVTSPMPARPKVGQDIFCSFVGSCTHPIRRTMVNTLAGDRRFKLVLRDGWARGVGATAMSEFLETTARSCFVLCPRGYGLNSFRLYEAMQYGSVPVYLSDNHWLPWPDDIDWDSIAVVITPDKLSSLPSMLDEILASGRWLSMLAGIEHAYSSHFTREGVCEQIERRLKHLVGEGPHSTNRVSLSSSGMPVLERSSTMIPDWILNDLRASDASWASAHQRLPEIVASYMPHEPTMGAELGIGYGTMCLALLGHFKALHLYCIDPFVPYDPVDIMSRTSSKMDELSEFTRRRISERYPERASVIRMTSGEAAHGASDEAFNFAFIDACHQYGAVTADIRDWWPKVKSGGILCGHDYGTDWSGVTRAVDEFANRQALKCDVDRQSSIWIIQKP